MVDEPLEVAGVTATVHDTEVRVHRARHASRDVDVLPVLASREQQGAHLDLVEPIPVRRVARPARARGADG